MDLNISELLGKTLTRCEKFSKYSEDTLEFETVTGDKYCMYHHGECCESVTIDDICGELNDLVGSPILQAEENSSNTNPDGVTKELQDSFTWTFYRFATIKGAVTIRWYGESNGYYSECVSFKKL